ncbi:phenylacetate--CoA ligase family protein [Candidatus Frankia nodulisporulans]|uniref:phenylacetate--CoA ligase family protein n=1 Tax=Candidatus Frankia nodulisporulans TaxID=2060052 RepID=UPI0013CFD185|nr:AMP-binding protein [Candidatus Frankia nodulisporulans]
MPWTRPGPAGWSSPDELAAVQRAELPRVLATALRSPFYAARYADGAPPRTAADFADVALTTKQDLRDAYPYGMLAVPRERLATYHESSGTSGEPTASYYTERDWTDLAERFARKWIGISPSDTLLVRTPYALVITGHLAHAAARSCGATVVPGDLRSLATPLSRIVRVLHDLEVTLTWCNPTEAMMLAAAARAAGLRPDRDFPALRAMFVAAEPLTEVRRRRISEIWGGVPVIEEYGSTETGTIAGQCPSGTMHLWADRAIFEVFDPATGDLTRTGRGQLVVTPLWREAMPLLRYNLADEVEVADTPCPCGWALPTVRVFGRAAFAYPVGPATVTQSRLEELVFALPAPCEVVFWRARADRDVLRVEIEVADEHRERAVKELRSSIDRELGVPHQVDAVAPGGIVPTATLRGQRDILKARYLFGPGEDWSGAVMYQ